MDVKIHEERVGVQNYFIDMLKKNVKILTLQITQKTFLDRHPRKQFIYRTLIKEDKTPNEK